MQHCNQKSNIYVPSTIEQNIKIRLKINARKMPPTVAHSNIMSLLCIHKNIFIQNKFSSHRPLYEGACFENPPDGST